MAIQRGIDGSEPVRGEQPTQPVEILQERRIARSTHLGTGTLACPACDAPVAPGRPVGPADPLTCPVCTHAAPVRDFLSLSQPTRPARVNVWIVPPGRPVVV